MFSLKKRPVILGRFTEVLHFLFHAFLPFLSISIHFRFLSHLYPKAKEQARKKLAAAAAGESIADLEERHIFMI